MTQVERETRDRRRTRILGILLLLIMVGSTAGYAFILYQSNTSNNVENNDQQEPINNEPTLSLSYGFDAVSDIPVNISFILQEYAGKTVYIDSEDSASFNEIARIFEQQSSRVQAACYGRCKKNLPEKNCSEMLVVVNSAAMNPRVRQQESCVFVDGDIKAVDAFLYRLAGKY